MQVEQLAIAPTDTVSSVRTRLMQLRGQRVLLIWDKDSDNLKRRVDLILLQREANRNAIQLALVADDKRLAHLAAEPGISCFDSAESAARARWRRSRSKVFLQRRDHARRQARLAELTDLAGASRQVADSPAWQLHALRLVLFVALATFVAGLVYALAPGAVLRVNLRQEQVRLALEFVADARVAAPDAIRAVIPALPLRETVETTATIPTTGTGWLDSAEPANRAVKVVAPDDPARLAEIARTQLQSLAYDRMRARLTSSQEIVIESLQIVEMDKDWRAFSAGVGEAADDLTLTMQAVATALAVDESLAKDFALARLKAAAPEGMDLQEDSLAFKRGAFAMSRDNQKIRFDASVAATARAQLDTDALRNELAGKSLDEARAILQAHDAFDSQLPRISLHPRGLDRMPLLPMRIQVELQEAA